MNTTSIVQKNLAFIGALFALFFVLSFAIGSYVAHAAMLDSQLDVGSTGQGVTDLQTYLAGNSNWYPSGLITGYFGNLTQGGIQKFQTGEGIVSSGSPATTGYGRVGPLTMARLNIAMSAGNQSSGGTVPVLGPLSVQRGQTTATFTWTTNEPTVGQVYWNTATIQSDEATGSGQTPYISGTLALDAGGLRTNHSVTISNLQANTIYHYVVRSIDASGDKSITLDNSFQTTQ